MSTELAVLLRALLTDPSKLGALTPEQEQRLMVNLQAVVGEERPVTPAPAHAALASTWSEGDLLVVGEAAAMLRVSPRWLYRHAKTLPFARKLSPKVLRFSRVGIVRWLATKRL